MGGVLFARVVSCKSLAARCVRDRHASAVPVALDAVNATRDFVHGKMAVGNGVKPERGVLADAGVALNSFNQAGAYSWRAFCTPFVMSGRGVPTREKHMGIG